MYTGAGVDARSRVPSLCSSDRTSLLEYVESQETRFLIKTGFLRQFKDKEVQICLDGSARSYVST